MSALAKLRRILLEILRGLSDEDAYARHLARRGVEHSPAEWRHFCDQHLYARYKRGRCC
jgi:uncharacterized short protein YbdD (DUF466 family)